jgi:hypothetical protein
MLASIRAGTSSKNNAETMPIWPSFPELEMNIPRQIPSRAIQVSRCQCQAPGAPDQALAPSQVYPLAQSVEQAVACQALEALDYQVEALAQLAEQAVALAEAIQPLAQQAIQALAQ